MKPENYFPSQELSITQFPQPPMQQVTPNSGAVPYVDPVSEQQINQGIVQGFGQFFFNAHDPAIAKTNIPIKQQSQRHITILVVTLLMIAGISAGIVILEVGIGLNAGIPVILGSYLIYLICSICCSEIRGYITNLKKFDDYKQTYDKMITGRGYFHFQIECYHYRTVSTKNGTRREKVVTHTASMNYYAMESIDESGNLTGIQELRKYVFIKYEKKFYFTDKLSENAFTNAYNTFVRSNTRDVHQTHTHTFQIQGFEEEVGFCMLGDSPHNSVVFYLFSFIGLSLPYSCILERSVSRYSINILKRLTCS